MQTMVPDGELAVGEDRMGTVKRGVAVVVVAMFAHR